MAAAVAAPPATADPDARMTPAVRRLLREHELTAAQIVGTGGGGRITREDVLKVVESIRTGGVVQPRLPPWPRRRPERLIGPRPRQPRPPHPPHHGRLPREAPSARRSSSPKAPTKSSCR